MLSGSSILSWLSIGSTSGWAMGATGRKAQPLLEDFWRAGKQIRPFLLQFQEHRAAGHILELAYVISPLPPLCNVHRELGPVPARMSVNELADPFQILCF